MSYKFKVVPTEIKYAKPGSPWKRIMFRVLEVESSDGVDAEYRHKTKDIIAVSGMFNQVVDYDDVNKTEYLLEAKDSTGKYARKGNYDFVSVKPYVDFDYNKLTDDEKVEFLRAAKFSGAATFEIIDNKIPVMEKFKLPRKELIEFLSSFSGISAKKSNDIIDGIDEAKQKLELIKAKAGPFKNYKITDVSLEKLIDHFGKSKTLQSIVDTDFYKFTEVKGFSFGKIDTIYLSNEENQPYDSMRVQYILIHMLEDAFADSKSWLTSNEIFDSLFHDYISNETITKQEALAGLKVVLANLLKKDKLVILREKDSTKPARFVLKEVFDIEQKTRDRILDMDRAVSKTKEHALDQIKKARSGEFDKVLDFSKIDMIVNFAKNDEGKTQFDELLTHLNEDKKGFTFDSDEDFDYETWLNLARQIVKPDADFITSGAIDFSSDNVIYSKYFINEGIKKAEDELGIKFTDEQHETIHRVIFGPAVVSINGYAGTGKSTITRAIDIIYDAAGIEPTQAVFTGRASDSLMKSTGFQASTVHSLLKLTNDDEIKKRIQGIIAADTSFDNVYEEDAKFRLLVIDEYSTLSIELFIMLLYTFALNTKLILIGDSEQLPALSFSTSQVVNGMKEIDRLTLTEVKRQASESVITTDSLKIRRGEVTEGLKAIANKQAHTDKDIAYIQAGNSAIAASKAVEIFKRLLKQGEKPEDITVLSPMNKLNFKINGFVRDEVMTMLDDDKSFQIGDTNDIRIRQGELVINLANNRNMEGFDSVDKAREYYTAKVNNKIGEYEQTLKKTISVYNGNTGKVLSIMENDTDDYGVKQKTMLVDFGTLGVAIIPEGSKAAHNLWLAYAMTTHKAQGSTIKNVIAILPNIPYDTNLLSKQMLYTSMTRAQSRLFVITDYDTATRAIKNNVRNNVRNDFDLLESGKYELTGNEK